MPEDRLAALEKEVKRLTIRMDLLIGLLAVESNLPSLGPPNGPEAFWKKVKDREAREGLYA